MSAAARGTGPGPGGPRARRRAVRAPAALISCVVLALAACGNTAAPTPSGPGSSPSPSAAAPTAEATATASDSPAASATAPATSSPPSPSPTPALTPTPVGSADPAAACSGKDAQRQFFAAIASAVDWDVYCAVLPAGWGVEGGTYHLADGGRMDISYLGPGAARFALEEGDFCTAGLSACEPHDQVLGTASFGDRQGALMTLGQDAGYAVYVHPGERQAWQATGTGMNQATFVALCAALAKVAG